jgi:Tfp pilus assembly protein PilN
MRAVNLLPKTESRQGISLPGRWVFVAALAPVLAACLVYYMYSSAHSGVQQKQALLRVVNEQLAAATAASSQASTEAGLVGERTGWAAALQDAVSKQMPWDVTLNDLARVLPPDVWLTNLNATSPTPANVAPLLPTATTTTGSTTTASTTTTTTTTAATTAPVANPTAFTLQGYAKSQNEIALVLSRLRLMPMLTDVTLGSTSNVVTPTGTNVVQFQVTANIQQLPTGGGA